MTCACVGMCTTTDCLQTGRLELVCNVEVPRAARKIRATFCPKGHITDPEYVVMGGEDTNVYIYDISKSSNGPLVVNQLQVRRVAAGLAIADGDLQCPALLQLFFRQKCWLRHLISIHCCKAMES